MSRTIRAAWAATVILLGGMLAALGTATISYAQTAAAIKTKDKTDATQSLLEGDPKIRNSLEFKEAAGLLRCPTCQGLSILNSDAQFSLQMKQIVEDKIAAGWDKEQIMTFFVDRYGTWIMRTPPKEGISLVAWLLPLTLLILGPLMVWLIFWRKTQKVTTFGMRTTEELMAQMDAELQVMRKEHS